MVGLVGVAFYNLFWAFSCCSSVVYFFLRDAIEPISICEVGSEINNNGGLPSFLLILEGSANVHGSNWRYLSNKYSSKFPCSISHP